MQIKKMKMPSFKHKKNDERVDSAMISLWIPLECKEQYRELQKQSHFEFGKHLKNVIVKQIKNAKIEE